MNHTAKASIIALALLALAAPAQLWAQGSVTIFGTVSDVTGAVVPSVSIAVTNMNTGVVRNTESNEAGNYVASELPIGSYSVRAEAQGFKAYVQENINVQVDENRRVDVVLELGAVTESISVQAAIAQVETRTGTIREVVDRERIIELPLNGRNALQLQYLVAGTGRRTDQGQRQNPNVSMNGSRNNANNYTLDSGDNHDPYFNAPAIFPNPDALEEFSIQTNAYGADKGRNAGVIMNAVTKSGTNEFHGTLFEFVRNEKLNARSFFANDVPPFKRNQFGGNLGGPVFRNKTFFFISYQRTTQRSAAGATTATVLTQAERQGDFSDLGKALKDPLGGVFPDNIIPPSRLYDPSQEFLDAFIPMPNRPNGMLSSASQQTEDDDQFIVKADHNFSDANRISGRLLYDFNKHNQAVGNIPGFLAQIEYTNWNLMLTDTHVFGPTIINAFTFSFSDIDRQQLSIVPGDQTWADFGANVTRAVTAEMTAAHDTRVDGYFRAFSRFPLNHFRNNWQFSDAVSWNKGRHFIKFGGDVRRSILSLQEYWRCDPFVRFRNTYTGWSAGDFLLGMPHLYQQISEDSNNTSTSELSTYVQDDWKVSQRLTLNLGFRWEPFLPLIDENNKFAQVRLGQQSTVMPSAPEGYVFPLDAGVPRATIKKRWANFSPRFGFAIDPTGSGKTSIRGGYGIFQTTVRTQANNQVTNNQPFALKYYLTKPVQGLSNPYSETGNPFPFTPPQTEEERKSYPFILPMSVTHWDPYFRNAVTQQWNFNVQRQFFGSYIVTAAYVGNKGNHLFMGNEWNPAIYGLPGNTDQRRALYPSFAGITTYSSQGNSTYHSMQLTLNKRLSRGVTILSNYTWGKLLDDSSSDGDSPTNPYDISNEKGHSDFDISHRFVTSFIWKLPKLDSYNAVLRHALGGWETNGIITLESGSWMTFYSGKDNSATGLNRDRADLVGDPHLDTGRERNALINQYFNTAAFAVNGPNTFGTSGRNILQGPGSANVDFGVVKNFSVAERHRVQFRAEFFNLFNRVNLGNPNTTVVNKNFGRITSAGSPRVVQLALKYMF